MVNPTMVLVNLVDDLGDGLGDGSAVPTTTIALPIAPGDGATSDVSWR